MRYSLKQQNCICRLMLFVISLTELYSQSCCTAVKYGVSKMYPRSKFSTGNSFKKILKVSKFTPNCIVYGETGRYDVVNMINVRMVNFWCRILTGSQNKFSFIIYSLTKKMHNDPSNNCSS